MNAIYRQAREDLAETRQRFRDERDRRLQKAVAACPALEELLQKRRLLLYRIPTGGDAFAGNLAAARGKLAKIDGKIRDALASVGMEESALLVAFDCPLCRDAGRVRDASGVERMCECVRRRAAKLVCGALESPRPAADFASFDIDRFDDTLLPGQAHSQRECMREIRDAAQRWCDDFGKRKRPHLRVMGKAGLGKSYLCGCIADRLEQRGYSVLYLTAYHLIQTVVQGFSSTQGAGLSVSPSDIRGYLLPDLLILDDLGSEPLYNNVTVETLFSILNERLSRRAPMVIVTNLAGKDIQQRYGERVLSRLLDDAQFAVVALSGQDVRPGRGARGGQKTQTGDEKDGIE